MKTPLYEQLYRYVRAEIDAGHLAAGARVPSEKELADQFHVSRITSKRALEKLAGEGVIQRARGRGSFVTAASGPAASGPAASGPAAEAVEEAAEEAAEEVGSAPFSPRVREGSTPPLLVGLLAPDISDAFGTHLVRTIEHQLRRAHLRVIFCRTQGKRDLEEDAIADCLALGVVGLIILPVHGEYYSQQLLRLVFDRFPLVLVDRYLRNIPACSVCTNNRQAAEDLVNHMIAAGHEHFAFITSPPSGTSSIEDRIAGVVAAIAGHALRLDTDEDLIYTHFTLPGALTPATKPTERDAEALRAYMMSHPEVTAYLACEYPQAMLAERVLRELHGAGAQRYAVACFDSPGSPLDNTHFTHIQQDEEGMGCEAVRLLLSQLAGEEVPRHVATKHTLVPGDAG